MGPFYRLALPSARRGPADQEVGEPAVDDLRVLDVGEVAARVEPAHGGAREAVGRLRAVRGGNGGILTTVHQENGQGEGGDGAAGGGAAGGGNRPRRGARGPPPPPRPPPPARPRPPPPPERPPPRRRRAGRPSPGRG